MAPNAGCGMYVVPASAGLAVGAPAFPPKGGTTYAPKLELLLHACLSFCSGAGKISPHYFCLMRNVIEIFESFAEADDAERKERWAMQPAQRLEILEQLS